MWESVVTGEGAGVSRARRAKARKWNPRWGIRTPTSVPMCTSADVIAQIRTMRK